jgi:hypothetical protein
LVSNGGDGGAARCGANEPAANESPALVQISICDYLAELAVLMRVRTTLAHAHLIREARSRAIRDYDASSETGRLHALGTGQFGRR